MSPNARPGCSDTLKDGSCCRTYVELKISRLPPRQGAWAWGSRNQRPVATAV